MSTGFDLDDSPPDGSMARWRRICRHDPFVLTCQQKYLDLPVCHQFDMPYLAGYSRKRNRLFIDRHVPYIQTIGKMRVNINPCLVLHEATESCLKDTWERWHMLFELPSDPQYEFCHHLATAVEYEDVESKGIDLKAYRKCLAPQIKTAAGETLSKIPSDLDLFPLQADNSPEGKKLLDHVRRIMRATGSSALARASRDTATKTKDEVNYRAYKAGYSKGPCGRCSMYITPRKCSLVKGDISPEHATCDEWEKK